MLTITLANTACWISCIHFKLACVSSDVVRGPVCHDAYRCDKIQQIEQVISIHCLCVLIYSQCVEFMLVAMLAILMERATMLGHVSIE